MPGTSRWEKDQALWFYSTLPLAIGYAWLPQPGPACSWIDILHQPLPLAHTHRWCRCLRESGSLAEQGKVCLLPIAELVFTPQGVVVKDVLILKSWHWWKPRTPGSYPLLCSLCFWFCQRQANAATVACKWGVAMTWLEHGSQQWSIFRSLISCQMN